MLNGWEKAGIMNVIRVVRAALPADIATLEVGCNIPVAR